jgi:hypothetical protein
LPSRLAFEQLKESASAVADIQYGMLKLSPRFDQILASLTPKPEALSKK